MFFKNILQLALFSYIETTKNGIKVVDVLWFSDFSRNSTLSHFFNWNNFKVTHSGTLTSKMNPYRCCSVLLALLNDSTPVAPGPLLHLFAGLPNILGVRRACPTPPAYRWCNTPRWRRCRPTCPWSWRLPLWTSTLPRSPPSSPFGDWTVGLSAGMETIPLRPRQELPRAGSLALTSISPKDLTFW